MAPILAAALVALASGGANQNFCRFVSAISVDVLVFEDTAINDEGELIASEPVAPGAPSPWIYAPSDTVRVKYRTGKGGPWIPLGRVTCTKGATLRVL
jgi:hypothetical protein